MTKKELDKIFVSNYGYLIKVACNRYRCIDFSKNIVNTLYVKLAARVEKLPVMQNEKKFLIKCLHNVAYTEFRKRKLVYLDEVYANNEPRYSHLEETIFAKELEDLVRKDLKALPNKQKMVIMGRIYNDLSFTEISERMGANYNTVKANGRHGIVSLTKKYKKYRRRNEI